MRLYYSPEIVYVDYSTKKLDNFFKFSLWTDRIFGPESVLERPFRKNVPQIFFSCSKKYITREYRQ